jgi:CRISPR-associated protein Cas1
MAWKGLQLTLPSRLSLADGQLCVKQDAGEVRIALEDLAWIVIDTPQGGRTRILRGATHNPAAPQSQKMPKIRA